MNEDWVRDIINSNIEIIALPVIVDETDTVYNVLFDKWDRFIKILQDTPELVNCIPYAEKSMNLLTRTLKQYYSGNIRNAEDSIRELIEYLLGNSAGNHLIADLESIYIDEESRQWFRGRVDKRQILYKQDMMHIPANLRDRIRNERYSFNGIPCLYIGNSINVCWEELRRPQTDMFWVCRYKPKSNIKLLNLSTTAYEIVNAKSYLKYVHDTDESYSNAVIEFFSNWILQSACSAVIEKDNRAFQEEYVIPQLIMQNINHFNVDGIMYFSTRMSFDYNMPSSWIAKNIAIPAFDTEGFDGKTDLYSNKIATFFDISQPINIGYYKDLLLYPQAKENHESDNYARKNALVFFSAKSHHYNETVFFECEKELQEYFK